MTVVADRLSNNTNQLTYPEYSRFELITSWLSDILEEHKINTDRWGSGTYKSFDHLRDEILNGESNLDLFEGKLHRVSRVVRLDVKYNISDSTTLKLVETEQLFSDGRRRDRPTDFAIWEKLHNNEDPDSAVLRAAYEELGIMIDYRHAVFKRCGVIDGCHEDYPGLPSKLTSIDYDLHLTPGQFNKLGYVEEQVDKATFFQWKAA